MSSLSTSSERDLESLQKELKWIRVQGKEDDLSSFEKLKKKCLENPVVPIGQYKSVGLKFWTICFLSKYLIVKVEMTDFSVRTLIEIKKAESKDISLLILKCCLSSLLKF